MTFDVLPTSSDVDGDLTYCAVHMLPVLCSTVAMLNAAARTKPTQKPVPRLVQTVYVTFLMSRARRMLPETDGQPVSAVNVNGGVKYSDGRILVYRKEDSIKVLIHELLHLFGYDEPLRSYGAQKAEMRLMRQFSIRCSNNGPGFMGIGECYIDAVACYLHVLATRGSVNDAKRHIDTVACRMLRHYGRKKATDVIPVFNENTHVFSYYICKAALWNDLESFLNRYGPHNAPMDVDEFVTYVCGCVERWEPLPDAVRRARHGRSVRMCNRDV